MGLGFAAILFLLLLAGMGLSLLVPWKAPSALLLRVLLTNAPWLGAMVWLEGGPAALAEVMAPPEPMLLMAWVLALLAFAVAMMAGASALGRRFGWTPPDMGRFRPFLAQRGGLSFGLAAGAAGGVFEELLFRGLMLPALSMMHGPGVAVAVQALLFGALHAYQGLSGVVMAGLLGLAFGGATVVSGSLWPALVAHVLLNLVGMVGVAAAARRDATAVRAGAAARPCRRRRSARPAALPAAPE